MKRILKWFIALLLVVVSLPVLFLLGLYGNYRYIVSKTPGNLAVKETPGNLGQYVNPFSGTGGLFYICTHNTPAATIPFGTVRLAPDTACMLLNKTGLNQSGYYYGDNKIIGFSHTRLCGAAVTEGGIFRVMPTTATRLPGLKKAPLYARFSHSQEMAFPGYYAVWLPKDKVMAEMTASQHVGVHRYTFKGSDAPHLLIDLNSAISDRRTRDAKVKIDPSSMTFEGEAIHWGGFSGRTGGTNVYFVARCITPFQTHGIWSNRIFQANATEASGDDVTVDLGFAEGSKDQVVELHFAISYVSIANARANLEAETSGKSFDRVLAEAKDTWEKRLSVIKITGGSETQKKIFYTALYRAFQMPTMFTDTNGEYKGFDKAIHKAEGFRYYTDFSLWDTFRAVHPLYNLLARKDERDMMVSLTEMAKAGGCLPRWPSMCGYTNCMFGTPADVAVSEAYLKGITDFEIETAYKSMRQVAFNGPPAGSQFAGREGYEWYNKYGYCPTDKTGDSVSATLEYAWADHALAQLAEKLGHKEDADIFRQRSMNYKNLWNPETQYFQPKDTNGGFPVEFKPLLLTYMDFDRKYTRDYVEGSPLQWRWGVPHDPEGFKALFKSPEYFLAELKDYFEKSDKTLGWWNPGPYYWHGNEPYIHNVYFFNTAGRPDLTQKYTRWIMDTKYADNYNGLDGNDDGGTLSSWYVLNALGFYPIAGTTRYELGTPLFERAEVDLGDNKSLTIIAEDYAPKNIYVQSASLNDKPLERTSFTHDQIASGGTLRFVMSETPKLSSPK
jgi:predicted alpha-1,2-mannosidase